MVFRRGYRDPCTRDVARLSESVKNTSRRQVFFYAFRMVILHGKPFGNSLLQFIPGTPIPKIA